MNCLEQFDKNKDGKICFEEFETMMTDMLFKNEVEITQKINTQPVNEPNTPQKKSNHPSVDS